MYVCVCVCVCVCTGTIDHEELKEAISCVTTEDNPDLPHNRCVCVFGAETYLEGRRVSKKPHLSKPAPSSRHDSIRIMAMKNMGLIGTKRGNEKKEKI